MAAFRDVLADCGLIDLGFVGLAYTYDNANMKVRLDRAMADTRRRDLFNDATLHHLVSSHSDHCPLLLEIKEGW
jgi:hypothetical protein